MKITMSLMGSHPFLKRSSMAVSVLLAAVLWMATDSGIAHADRFGPPWQSRVAVEQTILYSQPDTKSPPGGPLGKGAVVAVLGEKKGSDDTLWASTPLGFVAAGDLAEDYSPWVAEVTADSASVYAKSFPDSGIRRTVAKGDLLMVTGISAGLEGDTGFWWATTEGYLKMDTIEESTSDWAKGWILPESDEAPNGWWGMVNSEANVRAGTSTDAPIVGAFASGEHVKVLAEETGDPVGGNGVWYRIDGGRYPGARIHSSLITKLAPPTANTAAPKEETKNPWIVVDKKTETLTLVKGGQAIFTTYVSIGLAGAATPDGTYSTFAKYVGDRMSSRTVPGATHSYDLPNVPYTQYYKEGGYAIHGTYWHDLFGSPESQGCINTTWTDSKYLFSQTLPKVADNAISKWASQGGATLVVIVN